MAKKETLNTDKFDLDSELDFDSFGFDDVDSRINPEVKKGSKSRKVVTDVFRGSVSGFKDEFKKPQLLAKMTKDALPKSYGSVFQAASEVSQSTSRLYDEAVKEIKPQLGRIAKKIDRLVPDEQKTLKKMSSKISGMFGDNVSTQGPSREERMDQGVATALSQVFSAQHEASLQQEARATAETRIKDQVESKRFESNFGILNSINESTQRMSAYTERVTQAFQKKSLELQYRSYFVQNELLSLSGKFYEVFKNQNEAIVKNTGLPDYLKITMHERLGQTAKNKFAERANDFFFGSQSVIGRGMKKITGQAMDYMSGIKQGIEAALMGVETGADLAENMGSMGMSKSTLAGNALGAKGAGMFSGWLSKQLNKFFENSEKAKAVRRVGYQAGTIASNLPGAIDTLQKSQKYKDMSDKGGVIGFLTKVFDWTANNFKDERPDGNIENPNSIGSLSLGGKFDNRTQRSIVEVIPGYLAHILREINMFRTKSEDSQLLRYDFAKGKFSTSKEIYKSMNKTFSDKIKSSSQGFNLDNLASEITGGDELDAKSEEELKKFYDEITKDKSVEQNKTGILESKQYKALASKKPELASMVRGRLDGNKSNGKYSKSVKEFLLRISKIPNFDYTAENILATSEFAELQKRNKGAAKAVREFLGKQSSGDNEQKAKGHNHLTSRMLAIRGSTPDIRSEIQEFVNMGNADILIKEGVLIETDDGKYKINEDKYHLMVDAGTLDVNMDDPVPTRMGLSERFQTSDMHAKQGISKFSPKKALASIRKTSIFNWKYKKGKGNDRQHVGPMAQEVNRNIGKDAAPGGTTIDLVNMNGNNMAAIQALAEKQENILDNDKGSVSILSNIRDNIARIVELIEKSGSHNAGSGVGDNSSYTGILTSMFGNTGKLLGKGMSDIASAGVKTAKGAGELAVKTGEGLSKIYDKVKDPMQATAIWTLGKARDMFMKGIETTGDIMFDKIPRASKWLSEKGGKLGEWLSEKITDMKTISKDLYIKGRKNPVLQATLIQAGYYRDQATGKVIKTAKDLQNLKGNIVNESNKVIATLEDVAEGLQDNLGNKVKTGAQKALSFSKAALSAGFTAGGKFLKGLLGGATGLLDKGLEMLPASFKALFSGLGDIGIGSTRIYNVLVEMRDMMRGGASMSNNSSDQGEPGEFVGPMPQGLFGKIKDKVKGKVGALQDKLTTSRDKRNKSAKGKRKARKEDLKQKGSKSKRKNGEPTIATEEETKSTWKDKLSGAVSAVGKMAGDMKTKAAAAVGPTVAGKAGMLGDRVGSWKDRLVAQAERAKNSEKSMLQADLAPKYRSQENAIDMMIKKASGLFDMAKDDLGDAFGKAGDLMEGAGDLMSKSKGGKKGGIIRSMGRGLWGATKFVGRGLLGVGRVAGNVALAAVRNPRAALTAIRTAATVGSLMIGGVGSTLLAGVSAGMSAIGAIVSSPIVLGAAAVALTAYLGYKGYKYLTRNSANELEEIRLLQYGFTPDLKDHYHLGLKLEAYLNDGCIGFDGNKAMLLDKKVDKKEMLSIFSIDENDEEACAAFGKWFKDRFKPFFLTHVTAVNAIDNKVKLEDATKFKPKEKLQYLSTIGFNNGPYGELTSPTKLIPTLTDTKEATLALIKKLTDKYVELTKVKEKKSSTIEPEKPKAPAAVTAPKVDPVTKPADLRPGSTKPSVDGGDPFTGEEGKETIVTKDSVRGGNGIPKLTMAPGGLADGSGADQYLQLGKGVSLAGLNPELLKNLRAMAQEYGERTGKPITITSGSRSTAQQQALYNKNPRKAAKPGNSLHEFGLAIDVNSSDLDALEEAGLMRKYGFTRPVGGEPWHMEAIGIQGNLSLAKKDESFATQAIAASIGKGGGGVGTMDGVPLGKRNQELSMAILNTTSEQMAKVSDKNAATKALAPRTDMAANDSNVKAPAGSIAAAYDDNQRMSKYTAPAVTSTRQPSLVADGETKPSTQVTAKAEPVNPSNKEDVKNAIMSIAKGNGSDPNEAALIAAVESSLNPNAKSNRTSASGAFQFVNDTWKEQMGKHARKHGLDPNTPPSDLTASTLMATEYFKSNRKAISSAKANPNITDVYLAHLLGASGARKILSADPNQIAAQILPEAARKNPEYFYTNGKATTVAELYKKIDDKLGKVARENGINIPTGNTIGTPTAVPSATGTTTASAESVAKVPPSPTVTTLPRGSLVNNNPTVISPSTSGSMAQSTQMGTTGFATMADTLSKQLDVQTQMRDILKTIADKLDPEVLKDLNQKVGAMDKSQYTNSGPVNNSAPKTVQSAIDLRRKTA